MLSRLFLYLFGCLCFCYTNQVMACPDWKVTKKDEQYIFSDINEVAKWTLIKYIENEFEFTESMKKNNVTTKNARMMKEVNQGRNGLILGNGKGKLYAYVPFYDGDVYEFHSTESDAANYAQKYLGCDFSENFLEKISEGLHKNNAN